MSKQQTPSPLVQSAPGFAPASTFEALAQLEHVSFSYDGGRSWALDDISLSIAPGEQVCILGANGSGKSTLGKILAGSVAPDLGRVELLGKQVFDASLPADAGRVQPEHYRQARHNIGIVLQNPEDQIVTTVARDDVAFGPENLSFPTPRIVQAVDDALAQVGMSQRADHDPTRMSGGQQQRLAVAGNLAMEPQLIIMDEPGAMLDAAGRQDILAIMGRLRRQGKAVVHITHLLDEARQADRLLVLDRGRIVAAGRPEQVLGQRNIAILAAQKEQTAPELDPTADRQLSALEEHQPAVLPREQTLDLPANSPAVVIHNLSFAFPDSQHNTLSQISFEVEPGQTLAIMGRNGSGKSTLSKLLCALLAPTDGSIALAGLPLAGKEASKRGRKRRQIMRLLRQRVGYVMQYPEHQLFADTVAQDVAYGPSNLGLSPAQVSESVDDALELLGITALADRSPFELSGGQQRLVAIAGIVACNPQVLVLDEVTASLDPAASQRITALLRELHRRGVTIVMNTHSDQEALALADQALLLEQGRILASGPVQQVLERYHQLLADSPQEEVTQASQENDLPRSQAAGTKDLAKPTVSRTSPPTSLVNQLDPRAKIVSFLLMMFASFFISTPAQLLAGAAVTAALFTAARAPMKSMLKSVRVFLALILLVVPINLCFTQTGRALARWGPLRVTDQGLWIALLYASRFLLIILMGALLVESTTPTQMTDAFESLLKPLSRWGVHTGEIALVLSLALRFIPTLSQEVHSVVDAQAARGGSIESGRPGQRLRAAIAIAVPVFAGALRHANNLGQALDARSYEGGRGRTHYRRLQLHSRDWAFMGLVAVYLAALIALGIWR
ncbi:cobalt ABC transporter [Bombiscardovia apis]|uniref:Cobalt ABC transporter n=1 Tax=Bombiscardovia apis TaxID=2932182 RepID=A0ABN6SFY2_9BIFI|nr:energy-coupling factor transporter ATPase [Bombiscardovia apis]BDR54915.1 cobalt ABC transporter [Bombiscardovia apis]